jgi:hypothetical protein
MSRRELKSDDTTIEQRRMPADAAERDEGYVILVDPSVASEDYQAELAFNEEPVTIRLEPSSDENAIARFVVYVNGKGAEVFRNGRWYEIAWLPVGEVITIKRKYLEVIARTKIDKIRTPPMDARGEHPDNRPTRFTSAVHSFSVIEDRNPRGAAWLTELLRRNF